MRGLRPSANLNFTKPSIDLEIDKPGVLWFMKNSSVFQNFQPQHAGLSKKPEPGELWFAFSSGEWIRTTDLRVMSQNPESVPFARRVMHFSKPGDLWSSITWIATIVD